MTSSMTPMEDAIKQKITQELKPSSLEIFNDSHKHAHHKAMEGVTSRETHFRQVDLMVNIVSDAFKSKMQPARHRMVYTLLKDEMAAEGGIHALQLKTRTPEEEEKAKTRES
ncbi:hypothetical protein E4T48_02243 [Aureobasidium sp. EXF-10727]|nr:hypothetical protein E4T48_02243 [Aureobasidium sp. EXF-10727]